MSHALTPTITVHPRTLGAQEDGAVSYGRFRRFAILLPPERLTAMDPGVAWFEAATLMPPGKLKFHSLADMVLCYLWAGSTISDHPQT